MSVQNAACAPSCWIPQAAAEQLSSFRCHSFLETSKNLAGHIWHRTAAFCIYVQLIFQKTERLAWQKSIEAFRVFARSSVEAPSAVVSASSLTGLMPPICTPSFGNICGCSNGSGIFFSAPRSFWSPARMIIVTTFSLHIAQVGCSSGSCSFNFFVFSSMEVDLFLETWVHWTLVLCLDATLLLSTRSHTSVYVYS